jgi:hypothetical protein
VAPNRPPVAGAEDFSTLPNSPPGFEAGVAILPNSPPVAGCVVAAAVDAPNKPPPPVDAACESAGGAPSWNGFEVCADVVVPLPNSPPLVC